MHARHPGGRGAEVADEIARRFRIRACIGLRFNLGDGYSDGPQSPAARPFVELIDDSAMGCKHAHADTLPLPVPVHDAPVQTHELARYRQLAFGIQLDGGLEVPLHGRGELQIVNEYRPAVEPKRRASSVHGGKDPGRLQGVRQPLRVHFRRAGRCAGTRLQDARELQRLDARAAANRFERDRRSPQSHDRMRGQVGCHPYKDGLCHLAQFVQPPGQEGGGVRAPWSEETPPPLQAHSLRSRTWLQRRAHRCPLQVWAMTSNSQLAESVTRGAITRSGQLRGSRGGNAMRSRTRDGSSCSFH